jgi:hypothetical protein
MKYPYDREYDPYEEETNKEKYDLIRQVIFSCSSLLNAAKVRTCDEIVYFYFRDISGLNEIELQEKHEAIKPEIKDQWNKIEFAIANIKYPFLGSMLPVLDTEVDLKTTIFSSSIFSQTPTLL